MISLDQVQLLEKKVEAIFAKMNELRRENNDLRSQNRDLASKNAFLNQKLASFEADQNKIEQGIISALNKLNSIESNVVKSNSPESKDVASGKTIAGSEGNAERPRQASGSGFSGRQGNARERQEASSDADVSMESPAKNNADLDSESEDYQFDFGVDFDETVENSNSQEFF